MPLPKLLIAECSGFSQEAVKTLESQFRVELADLDRAALLNAVGDVECLWVRLRTMIDAEVMDAAPQLRVIATNTTGLNHIDLDAAAARGVRVVSLRGETDFLKTIRATAEHTIGLTLALLRKIPQAHQHVLAGGWDRDQFQGAEIFGKKVGIIGYGRLGRIVAGYFRAFGATVVVTSRELTPGSSIDAFEVLTLNELLKQSEIVSLHVSYEPSNRQMIAHEQFRLMKPDAVFVNTARGELVDEEALAAALDRLQIGAAAIDVVDRDAGLPLCLKNFANNPSNTARLLVTPHIGGNTHESLGRTEVHLAELLVEAFTLLCDGGAPLS